MNRGNGGGTKRGSDAARGSTAKKRRFVWPDELHASFVSAVFDVGLRTATPEAAARRGVAKWWAVQHTRRLPPPKKR